MSKHQDIAFNVTGQTLYWDCPEGTPSSVTSVTVFPMTESDDGTAETATTGSASIDSVSTTVNATSGYGQSNPRTISLASTTGIVIGQSYLLIAAGGEKEWIVPVSITASTVTARHPLQNTYLSAATFKGVRISISLADAWVQDEENLSDGLDPTPGWRARWVYVVNSVTYVHDGYFDVVRYLGAPSLTPADVEAMYPDYRDRLPTYHRTDEGRRMIADAYEQVRFELQANDLDDASIRDVDAVNRATLLRFGVLLARANFRAGSDIGEYELAVKDYDDFMNKLFRITMKVRQSTDTTGAGAMVPARGIMER